MQKPPLPQKLIYISILSLIIVAAVATAIRVAILDESNLPTGDTAWTITVAQEIEALDKNAVIRIAPPYDTSHARLYSQALTHPGL